jgi:hypothetical protein
MRRWHALGTLLLAASVTSACSDDDKKGPTPLATTSAPPGASASTATSPAKAEDEPVCQRVERKVWGAGANTRTGITPAMPGDGRVLIGLALGDHPHVLELDANGAGKLRAVELDRKTALARKFGPNDGVRHLQRVTVTGDGKTFADYRDKQKDGHRRVACGPTTSEHPFLVYDGEPLLEVDDTGAGRKTELTPAALASAAPLPSALTPAVVTSSSAPAGTAAADAPPAPAPKPEKEAGDTQRELRDCRTLADADGKAIWATGSELTSEKEGDTVTWSMRFFVVPDAGRAERVTLHVEKLGEKPTKLHTLEAPVAHRLSDGSYVLAGRYRGRMLAWLLSPERKVRQDLRRYSGGYPGLPRIIADGSEHLLLTSQQINTERWSLRALRLGKTSKLHETFLELRIGDEDDSLAEPTLAHAKDQRWLAYHDGDRRKGRIHVAPVDENLAQIGKPFAITEASDAVYESHLFGFKDKLVLVYLSRPAGKPAELVSEVLSCSVRK